MRAVLRALLALPALALLLSPRPSDAQQLEPLAIVTAGARHDFMVEVARDDATRAQGLMYRRSLGPDRGMLFDFKRVEPVSMWMQNTYVSLDMLFIRPDGTIARVAAEHRAALDPHHPVRRAGAGGARGRRRHRGPARHQGRRSRRAPAVQGALTSSVIPKNGYPVFGKDHAQRKGKAG